MGARGGAVHRREPHAHRWVCGSACHECEPSHHAANKLPLNGQYRFGLQLENSIAFATDATFEAGSVGIPAGMFLSSRLSCSRCTFTSPGPQSVMTVINSLAAINQSAFTGGPVRAEGSTLNIGDSTISSTSPGTPSINATLGNSIILTRVEILGRMFFGQGTTAALNAVTQTGIGMQPNEAGFGSTVVVASAGQPAGGPPNIDSSLANFSLSNFSNLVLNPGSTIGGDLICRTGSNAHCANPANVTGATNCGLCPKP